MFKLISKLIQAIKLRSYNEYTIIELFRKQGAIIGDNCRIYAKYLAGEPYLVKIGDHVSIGSGVSLITHDGAVWVYRQKDPTINRFGKIEIKDNCFIGNNTIILPNVVIGPNSIVGAGAVVTKDVPENCVVAGNPAKIICKTEEYIEKCKKESIQLPGDIKEKIKSEKDANKFDSLFKEVLIKKYWG